MTDQAQKEAQERAQEQRAARPRRLRLQGGLLVTMNRARDVVLGDLVIEGDRITAIQPPSGRLDVAEPSDATDPREPRERADLARVSGPRTRGVGPCGPSGSLQADEAVGAGTASERHPWPVETIDCRGHFVFPGFIQPHVHLCQTLLRGGADGLTLLSWLRTKVWPFEAAHTPETLRASATLGVLELLRSGTTAILDMGTVRHTEAIFEVCASLGIRATIGKAMMDLDRGQPSALLEGTDAALLESARLADRWHGAESGRLRYAMTPRFALSCTEPLLREAAAEARRRGLLFHTHASETEEEVALVRKERGADNVAYLDGLGAVGSRTVLAHCIWLSPEEVDRLAAREAHVVHCPSSNLKLGSGIARVPELLERGINVALAADGAPCSNDLDVFTQLRLAGLIHNVRYGPDRLSARAVVEMATLHGARALGLEHEIGSLEVGKKADVVVVDARGLHVVPGSDPYSASVYALRGSDVQHVIVDGIQRVRHGELLGVDLPRVIADVKAAAAQCTP